MITIVIAWGSHGYRHAITQCLRLMKLHSLPPYNNVQSNWDLEAT